MNYSSVSFYSCEIFKVLLGIATSVINFLSNITSRTFELVVEMLDKLNDRIPLTFMLGFYVTNVASRWWTIIMNIGFTDK